MKAPFGFMRASGGAPAADFRSMVLSGLWLDSYDGAHSWGSIASAGSSGSGGGTRDFTDIAGGLIAPAYGVSLNGHTTVRWNRANSESLRTTGTMATEFVPTDLHKWSFGILLNVIDVSTNFGGGGSTYLNETYMGEFGGNWNVSAYSSGPNFTVGTWPTSSDIPFSTGSYAYLQGRGLPGGDTQARLGGGSWTSPVSGSGILSGGVLWAGRGNTAAYVNATVAAMWIADSSLSDGDFDFSLACARAYSGLALP